MKPTAFPFAAKRDNGTTSVPRQAQGLPGAEPRELARGETEPRPRDLGEASRLIAGAGYVTPAVSDVAIYELTGPWSTYRWLCAADVAVREAQGWTARKRQDAARVDSCDDCELRRQKETQ